MTNTKPDNLLDLVQDAVKIAGVRLVRTERTSPGKSPELALADALVEAMRPKEERQASALVAAVRHVTGVKR